ncbi:unnamed protein product [Protopolystoma xenopodis]|uniref:Uncharacterized protein n=1 Tax=Protopolystoma xenopodis TaxID=117903 RepID=A0A3S5AYC1_9PLAT|nr:unnamed protein product [Protopolystoma xenopodis]
MHQSQNMSVFLRFAGQSNETIGSAFRVAAKATLSHSLLPAPVWLTETSAHFETSNLGYATVCISPRTPLLHETRWTKACSFASKNEDASQQMPCRRCAVQPWDHQRKTRCGNGAMEWGGWMSR